MFLNKNDTLHVPQEFLRRVKDLLSIHFKLNAASHDQTAEPAIGAWVPE